MKVIGIELRRPGFNELTAAVIMGAGLWVLAVGLARVLHWDLGGADAGALLLVMLWGCVSVRLGVRPDHGPRHLLLNVAVAAALLGVYQAAWALVA